MPPHFPNALWFRPREHVATFKAPPQRLGTKRASDPHGSWGRTASPAKRLAAEAELAHRIDTEAGDVVMNSPAAGRGRFRAPLVTLSSTGRGESPEWSDQETEPKARLAPPRPPKSLARSARSLPHEVISPRLLPTLDESSEESAEEPQTAHKASLGEMSSLLDSAAALTAARSSLTTRLASLPAHLRVAPDDIEAAMAKKSAYWRAEALTNFEQVVARNAFATPHLPLLAEHGSRLSQQERRGLLLQLEIPRPHLTTDELGALLRDDLQHLALAGNHQRHRIAVVALNMKSRDLLPLRAWLPSVAAVRASDEGLRKLSQLTHELCPAAARATELMPVFAWLIRIDAPLRRDVLLAKQRLESLIVRGTLRAQATQDSSLLRFEARHTSAMLALLQQYGALVPAERPHTLAWLEQALEGAALGPTLDASIAAMASLMRLAGALRHHAADAGDGALAPLVTVLNGVPLSQADADFVREATAALVDNVSSACRVSLEPRHAPLLLEVVARLLQLHPALRGAAVEYACVTLHQKRFLDERSLALRYAAEKIESCIRCAQTND